MTLRKEPRAHYRRVDRGLGKALFKGLVTVIMGPARLARFNPPLYPRDAQSSDLERIGGDMYAAFEALDKGQVTPPTSQLKTKSEVSPESEKLPSAEIRECPPDSIRTAVVESAAFSGPQLPPTTYRGYDEVLPGSAERILRMAEKEQNHRIGWEGEAMHRASQHGHLGLWFGFLIAVFALVTSASLAMNGHDLVAGVIGCSGIAGAAAGFIRERRRLQRFFG